MKKTLLLGIMAVALLASVPAFAVNAGLSLHGETGVANTPMAAALPAGTLAVAADFVTSKEVFIPARLEFGVIEGLEVGAQFWYANTDPDTTKIYGANAKYVIPYKFVDGLSTALGARYVVASSGTDVNTLDIYGVATYKIDAGGLPVVPSIGLQWSNVDTDFGGDSGFRFFASLVVMAMPNLGIGGELVTTNSDLDGPGADTYLWFGARFMPMDNLTVQAGVINNANIGGADPSDWSAHVGLQYAFSLTK